jgi:hypothetical protein
MPDRASDPTQWRHANPILDVPISPERAYYRDVFGLIPTWLWEDDAGA